MSKWFVILSSIFLINSCGGGGVAPGPNLPKIGEGYEVGNGELLVQCAGSSPAQELIDFYRFKIESREQSGGWIETQKSDPSAIVAEVLDKLARLDPKRAAEYRSRANQFVEQSRLFTDVILPDTRDFGDLPVASDCTMKQLIVQRPVNYEGQAKYFIQSQLWDTLTSLQKAAAILHEVIYTDAIQRGHKSSVGTQRLTVLLFRQSFSWLTQLEYNKLMSKLEFATSHDLPPVWESNVVDLDTSICRGTEFQIDISLYTVHFLDDLIAYEPVRIPSWMQLESNGIAQGRVPRQSADQQSFSVRATNGKAFSDAEIRFRSPNCDERQEIRFDACPNVFFRASLPFFWGLSRYELMSNRSWLDYSSSSGNVGGTPWPGDEGSNRFLFRAWLKTPDREFVDVVLNVDVAPAGSCPQQQKSVPKAGGAG